MIVTPISAQTVAFAGAGSTGVISRAYLTFAPEHFEPVFRHPDDLVAITDGVRCPVKYPIAAEAKADSNIRLKSVGLLSSWTLQHRSIALLDQNNPLMPHS